MDSLDVRFGCCDCFDWIHIHSDERRLVVKMVRIK